MNANAPTISPPPDVIAGPLDPASFPHPPKAGSFNPPTTIENVQHMLQAYRCTVRYDVIKKRLDLRRDEKPITVAGLVSLAVRNGLNTGLIPMFADEIGMRMSHNPVERWIRSKPWDGVDRLSCFYDTVTARDDYPHGLKDILIHRWMLSVTAAALTRTRFQAHGVLTLQGDQGLGKTSWIAKLVPDGEMRNEWVKLDHHLDGSNKDSILAAIAHWIVEIGELDSSFKKDVARLKGFLTNDCDKIRRPYARDMAEYPRRTVFAATVNEEAFLVDPTGNRRFWTIGLDRLDYQHDIDMQQLYAQLAVELHDGAQWWLKPEEARQLAVYNLRHRSVSAIAERIRDRIDFDDLEAGIGVPRTAIEVLAEIGVASPSNSQCKECGAALRELVGSPKRINGRDKWRVPFRSSGNYSHVPDRTPQPCAPGEVF